MLFFPFFLDFVEHGRGAVAWTGSGACVIATLKYPDHVSIVGDETVEIGLPVAVSIAAEESSLLLLDHGPVNSSMNLLGSFTKTKGPFRHRTD
jgi:hypothetical protein